MAGNEADVGGGAETAGAEKISLISSEIVIKELNFEPHTIFVTVGSNITWMNNDQIKHTVLSNEGWFNGELDAGETFSWQPTKPGIYRYHCTIHESMEGTVVVLPGGAVAAKYYNGMSVKEYYIDSCGGCHGPNREGATGVALIPQRLTEDDDFYFKTIKNGRPGTVMPGWGQFGLSDEEIWGIVGFIRSKSEAGSVEWGVDKIEGSLEVLVNQETFPESPEHSGNLDNLMLVTERENRTIAVIDGDTHTLLGHVEASYRAHGYAFDPTNDRWAYNVGRDGWLFKIDLYALKATKKVRVGLDSRGIAISDDGKYLIVGNYIPNTAVILDSETLKALKVINTEGVDPDGNFVQSRVCIVSDVSPELIGPYFIIALKEAGQVWRIDYSSPDFPITKVEDVGRILHDGFLSPDNHYFYIASQKDNWMTVIDVEKWAIVEKISTGDTPHPGSGAVWEADGTTYGATVHAGEGKVTIWDLTTNEIAGTVETKGPGLFIRSADNSPYVWADALFGTPSNTITAFNKEKPFKVEKVIEEGKMTLHPELTADGKYVYISDWNGDVVRVYDAETFEKVREISGIKTPTGIFNTHRRYETLGH